MLVKKLLLLGSLCLFLGTATTIGVAWYCTIWLEWNHWSPVARGLTKFDVPLWLVVSYEAPGFKLAHAWPILDSDDLFGMQPTSTYGYQPYSLYGPLLLQPWMVSLAIAPRLQEDASSLRTIDCRGWPRPSMYRIFHTELDSKAQLAIKSQVLKPVILSDNSLHKAWVRIRKDLMQSKPLPLKPYWPGFLFDTAIYSGAWILLFSTFALFRKVTNRWRFWRKFALVLLCLISGVLTTIAVSWGCSAWIDIHNSPQPFVTGGRSRRLTAWEHWYVDLTTKPGMTRFWSRHEKSWPVVSYANSTRPAETMVPWWADDTIPIYQDHNMALYGSGWPVHALWWWEDTLLYYDPDAIAHGGIKLSPWTKPNNPQLQRNNRAIPLMPIWPGLVADTAFYSFCTFGLFALWQGGVLTRRWWRLKHKGLCPNCKYDLRELTSEKCPECGHHIDKSDLKQIDKQPNP